MKLLNEHWKETAAFYRYSYYLHIYILYYIILYYIILFYFILYYIIFYYYFILYYIIIYIYYYYIIYLCSDHLWSISFPLSRVAAATFSLNFLAAPTKLVQLQTVGAPFFSQVVSEESPLVVKGSATKTSSTTCFFFHKWHNRVPSKQIYYWGSEPLERLFGCCV